MPDPNSRITYGPYFPDPMVPVHVFTTPQLDSPLHDHDFTEIVFVLDGTGKHCIAEGSFTISTGDVFVINDDRAHAYRDTQNLRIINMLVLERRLLELAPVIAETPGYRELFHLEPAFRARHPFGDRLRLKPDDLPMLLDTVHAIRHELQTQPPGHRQMVMALTQTVIVQLCRRHQREPFPTGDYLESIGRVLSHLENHFRDETSVADMADIACMSQRSFLRHFRAATNLRPKEYLLRVRLAEACKRLRGGGQSVSAIAFDCGFTDSNYFARCFRAVHGLSPSDYRQHEHAGSGA